MSFKQHTVSVLVTCLSKICSNKGESDNIRTCWDSFIVPVLRVSAAVLQIVVVPQILILTCGVFVGPSLFVLKKQ